MSDCCQRTSESHNGKCADWWEQAYGSEYRRRKEAEEKLAAMEKVVEAAKYLANGVRDNWQDAEGQAAARSVLEKIASIAGGGE